MLSLQSRQLWEAATSFPAFNTVLGKDKHGKHVLEGDNPRAEALAVGKVKENQPLVALPAQYKCTPSFWESLTQGR